MDGFITQCEMIKRRSEKRLRGMKKFLLGITAAAILLLAGCGPKADLSAPAQTLCGKWAYIHDETTTVLQLKDDGKAVFHEEKYTWDCDGEFISLTDNKGTATALRYAWDDQDIYLYEQTIYTCQGTHDGLIGKWVSEKDHWSFEFTTNGTFDEDGYFPGHYSVDEAAGTFRLAYNDPFEDTTCYYQINGDELLVEYPWHMVSAK